MTSADQSLEPEGEPIETAPPARHFRRTDFRHASRGSKIISCCRADADQDREGDGQFYRDSAPDGAWTLIAATRVSSYHNPHDNAAW